MNMIKKFAIAATIAAGALATSVSAAPITAGGFTYTPDGAPFSLEAAALETDSVAAVLNPGGPLSTTLDLNTNVSGEMNNGTDLDGGTIWFRFVSSVAGLFAVNTSTTNDANSYEDLRISWCADADASGCIGELAFIEEPVSGVKMSTYFAAAGEVQWLVATWSGVTGTNNNLDFKVTTTVPVPAAGLLLLAGLGGLGAMKRRKG